MVEPTHLRPSPPRAPRARHPETAVRVRRVLAAFGAALLVAGACAPSPKTVRCTNGGECTAADPRYEYCLEGRCVECVANTSCGIDNRCVDGFCERKCKDTRDCPEGQWCLEGKCGDPP